MVDPEPVQLGTLIRRFRLAAGMSQEQLAERSGLSARALSDLERGLRTGTRPETLRMLADGLSLDSVERENLLLAARPELRKLSPSIALRPAGSWRFPDSTLIGRDRDIAEIVRQLTGPGQLVTLTGPGGVGKTRVALEAGWRASQVLEREARFVDLSTVRNPDLVVPTIAQALGVHEVRGQSMIESLALALQQQRALLLLDNFEQVIAAAPIVGALMERAPDLRVLVTSREALRIHREIEIVIDPLSLPQSTNDIAVLKESASIEFFEAAATRFDPAFNSNEENVVAVAGICRRLDGLPLAIELAASRVRHFPPALLLERMERRLPVLTGGRRDLPARQQTLRNAIAWSYELLLPDEQLLFCRIGAFPGGATLDALDAYSGVAGSPDLDLISGLASLIDKHLVRETKSAAGTLRFSMLETIREFAGEMIAHWNELETSRDAVLAHALNIAGSGAADFHTWWVGPTTASEMDGEIDNIRLAFDIAAFRDDALTFAQLHYRTNGYFYQRGFFREAFDLGQQAIELARSAGLPDADLGRLLVGHAGFWINLFDAAGAENHARDGLALAERTLPIVDDVVPALSVLAMVVRELGRYEEALTYAERADELSISGIAESFKPLTTFAIGKLAYLMGNQERAIQYLGDSKRYSLEYGTPEFAIHAGGLLAATHLSQGQLLPSASELREVIRLWTEIGESGPAVFLDKAAILAALGGFPETAAQLFAADTAERERFGMVDDVDAWIKATQDVARDQLGEARFDHEGGRGRSLGRHDVIALIMGMLDQVEAGVVSTDDTNRSSAE